LSAHSFGWLGRRRHAADPLTPWQSHEVARTGLPLRPLEAVTPLLRREGSAPAPAPAGKPPAPEGG